MRTQRTGYVRARRDQRGGVLVFALIAALTVMTLGAAFLQLNMSRTRAVGMSLDNQRAFYVAEAGLSEAYWGVMTGRSGGVGSVDAPAGFGHGLFWVETEDLGDDLIALESTGMYGRGRVTLGLVVRREIEEGGALAALAVNEGVVLGNDNLVDGYDSSLGSYASQADLSASPVHTAGGALVMANADIVLGNGATIYGDATPAPFGAVVLGKDASVSGATTPGASVFQLPPVELPGLNVPGGDLLHKGVVPLILPPGETGYGAIQVGPDAELRIQGPATVEMSSLVLDARASLVIDATAGPVEIFIKKEIVLNSGSTVTTTTEDPTQVTLQVAAADKKKTSVQLNASTSFFGYLYAPEAHVEMNSGFEIYGGLACNAATFNKGARIHVDAALSAGGTGSTGGPEVLTWRVIDIPETVPLSVKNPFDALGVDADALPMPDQAHAATWLQVKWVDLAGDTQSFEGWDTDFDWSIVDGPLKSLKVYDGPALSKVLYFKGSK